MAAIAASRKAEIVALADPLEDSVAKAGELVPEAARLRTLEELLEMEIEGLVIATPSALHASQTVSVLSKGIGVFCQKPLGRDVREVSSAIEAAKAADRLLGVDLSYRFTTALGHVTKAGAIRRIGQNFCRRPRVSQRLRTPETVVLRSKIGRGRLCHGSGDSFGGCRVVDT